MMSRVGVRMICRAAVLCISVGLCITDARAQAPDTSAIYLYKGADRAERLVAKAREEGTLTFYTSMATTESGPLAQAFEKKYGVKVQLWRALSENVLQRTLTEARGILADELIQRCQQVAVFRQGKGEMLLDIHGMNVCDGETSGMFRGDVMAANVPGAKSIDAPGEEIGDSLRGALVGNVLHVDASAALKHFHREMCRSADTTRRKVELAGFGLRERD